MNRRLRAVGAVALLLALVAPGGNALAAKGGKSSDTPAVATITDGLAVGSDASGPYVHGVDGTHSLLKSTQYSLQPQGSRRFTLHFNVGGQSVAAVCGGPDWAQLTVFNGTNPLVHGQPADTRIDCVDNASKLQWLIDYPPYKFGSGTACVAVVNAGTTWEFAADSGCVAKVYLGGYQKQNYVGDAAVDFHLTVSPKD